MIEGHFYEVYLYIVRVVARSIAHSYLFVPIYVLFCRRLQSGQALVVEVSDDC